MTNDSISARRITNAEQLLGFFRETGSTVSTLDCTVKLNGMSAGTLTKTVSMLRRGGKAIARNKLRLPNGRRYMVYSMAS